MLLKNRRSKTCILFLRPPRDLKWTSSSLAGRPTAETGRSPLPRPQPGPGPGKQSRARPHLGLIRPSHRRPSDLRVFDRTAGRQDRGSKTPSPLATGQKTLAPFPHRLRRAANTARRGSAVAHPLAGARTHPRVSAPPSSGCAATPLPPFVFP